MTLGFGIGEDRVADAARIGEAGYHADIVMGDHHDIVAESVKTP